MDSLLLDMNHEAGENLGLNITSASDDGRTHTHDTKDPHHDTAIYPDPTSAALSSPLSQDSGASLFSEPLIDPLSSFPLSEPLSSATFPESFTDTLKTRPAPLRFPNSPSQPLDFPKVPSSPRFSVRPRNRRVKSPWSQKPVKEKEKRPSNVNREKRRRMTAELQASVEALHVKDEFTFPPGSQLDRGSPKKTSASPVKAQQLEISPEGHSRSMTLWGYLLLELASQKNEVFTNEKTEQLVNFMRVPLYLERVITFGTLMCLDSFLHFFTILPLRFIYALYLLCKNTVRGVKTRLPMSRKADIIKGFMFALTVSLLLQLDTSKIYHNIRGQSAVKLYVMFNVLEIADKLFSALGQDILECLFSYETLQRHYKDELSRYYRPVVFAVLGIVYVYFHSLAILYQIIALNVAVNSYSNALLTLLLSNQFAEIKSAVFKKFERENLFQLTCADITERFQLTIILFIIGLRNIADLGTSGLIPRSWSGWNTWLGALMGPMSVVVGSEVLVDWLKHAYIAKFNNIRPRVYRKFLDVLAYDYSENSFTDDVMMKRIGLPVFPIASVFFRMLAGSYGMLAEQRSPLKTIEKLGSPSHTGVLPPNSTRSSEAGPLHPSDSAFPLNLLDDLYSTSRKILPYIESFDFDNFYRYLSLVLVGVTVFILLFALKLMLGLSLLQYSAKRRGELLNRAPPKLYSSTSHPATQQKSEPNTPTAAEKTGIPHGYESDENDHVPGIRKGGPQSLVELPKHLRDKLYFPDETIPPQKGRKHKTNGVKELLDVRRFKMTAKQIW